MTAFITPPIQIPLHLKLGLWLTRRIVGKDLLLPRLLAWYPRAALSSGVLEVMIAHQEGNVTERLLKLVRLYTSFIVGCPFCIDMNSIETDRHHISEEEMAALQRRAAPESVATLTAPERLALAYTHFVCSTPIALPTSFVAELHAHFTEREIVVLATTIAQVNYWTRLAQALGVPPAGFMEQCQL